MSLAEIQSEVERLAAVIDAPEMYTPVFDQRPKYLRPRIVEAADGTLSWVAQELGRELERRSTRDVDELLYWTFGGITRAMAGAWEREHRVTGLPTGMVLVGKQLSLLASLKARWSERAHAEIVETMRKYPHKGTYSREELAEAVGSCRTYGGTDLPAEQSMVAHIEQSMADQLPLSTSEFAFVSRGLAMGRLASRGVPPTEAKAVALYIPFV